jgi:hypothetical protein
MIPVLGAGGPGFKSRLSPIIFCLTALVVIFLYTYRCPLSSLFLELVTSLHRNFKGKSTANDWNTVENSSRMNPDALWKIVETTLLFRLPVDCFHGSHFADRILASNNQVPMRV